MPHEEDDMNGNKAKPLITCEYLVMCPSQLVFLDKDTRPDK